MKEKMQGIIIGALVGTLGFSGVAYAKSAVENISVKYDNIKVYRDNVLCDLKTSNGTKVEPFIYNGTTYLPLRATADLAGMSVTYDGATKSVYLWDNLVASNTYLMEACPPYETSGMDTYLQTSGKSFEMGGKKYSNGLESRGLIWGEPYALFNLDGRYSTMHLTVGQLDGYSNYDRTISFIVDGRVVKEVELAAGELPETLSVPLNYGLQLKIATDSYVGFGDITVS